MFGYGRGPNQMPGSNRQVPMIREIWIKRDEFGFGFSIAGENPCHINHVVPVSPADRAGLRQLELILLINGRNVRQFSHENVLKELDLSGNLLKLGICENMHNSINSVNHGLAKPHLKTYMPQMDKQNKFQNHEPFHECQQKIPKNQNRIPVRQKNRWVADSAFENQRFSNDRNLEEGDSGSEDEHNPEVGLAKNKLKAYCKDKYAEATSKKRVETNPKRTVLSIQKPMMEKFNNVSDLMKDSPFLRHKPETSRPSNDKENKANKQISGQKGRTNHRKKDEKISLPKELMGVDINTTSASWFVVNYISSTDVPFDRKVKSHADGAAMAARRACATKGGERVSLMFARHEGIKLINRSQILVGNYGMEQIKWCGEPMSSGGGKMFVIAVASKEHSNCNTYHVFSVDPNVTSHSKHAALASIFRIKCSTTSDDTCLEFPRTVDEVICCIAPCVGQIKPMSLKCNDDDKNTINTKQPASEFTRQENIKFFNNEFETPSEQEKKVPEFTEPLPIPTRRPPSSKSQNSISKTLMSPPPEIGKTPIKGEFQSSPNKRIFTSTPCKPSFDRRKGGLIEGLAGINPKSPSKDHHNDSNLMQNKSICSSYEGFLDNIEKCNKKGRLSEENEFNKRFSISYGAIDKAQEAGISRARQWAVNFEFLLNDEAGVATFMQFLKNEFCSENLVFWLKCKSFKKLFNSSPTVENKVVVDAVKEIYGSHVNQDAPFEVNIDCTIRKKIESRMNDDPASLCDVFDAAQKHIQQLMKQDKYARFKVSELYDRALNDEKNGKVFEHTHVDVSVCLPIRHVDNAMEQKEKPKADEKRKSLLNFWKRRKSIRESFDGSVNQMDGRADDRCSLKSSSSNNLRPPSFSSINSLSIKRVKSAESYCRAVLPETGITARILTSNRSTVAECLSKLGSNIDPGMPFVLPADEETGRLVSLSEPSNLLNNKVIIFQRLGYFRLDVTRCKPLLVRYKLDSILNDVLQPILFSLGFDDQDVILKISNIFLPRDEWKMNASLFNCKAISIEKGRNVISPETEIKNILQKLDSNKSAPTIAALKDLFQDVLPQVPKNSPFTTFFCYLEYDEHGTSNLKGAEEWFKMQKKTSKLGLFNFLKRTSIDKGVLQGRSSMQGELQERPVPEKQIQSLSDLPIDNHQLQTKTKEKQQFINLLSKAQAWNFDEQRGKCSAQYTKLPDFLKEQDDDDNFLKEQDDDNNFRPDEIEICPDLLPCNNRFIIDRRNKRENVEFMTNDAAFELLENNWDDLLNDDDKMLLFGREGILPSVEEADMFFSGGASPPPLTIIERGTQIDDDGAL